jgi:hypothetical protein
MSGTNDHYGPDAQLDRDYESLTDKQQEAVDALIEADAGDTQAAIAADCSVAPSYLSYVRENFPHIIRTRSTAAHVAAVGGGGGYTVTLSPAQAWACIDLLPEDLSRTIFNQVRMGSVDPDSAWTTDDERDE